MKLLYTTILCLILSGLSLHVSAQDIKVDKSNEQELIGDKIFFIHHVKVGETIYSISKTYNVAANIIIECNNKNNFTLSIGETLNIPKDETKDNRYFYHSLKQGETLYSISKNTGVKLSSILEHNTNIKDISDISVGAYIKIPIDSISNQDYITNQKNKNSIISNTLDSIKNVKNNINLSKSIIKEKDTNVSTKQQVNKLAIRAVNKDFCLDSIKNKNINIALFLPLYLNENDSLNKPILNENGEPIETEKKIYSKSLNFIDFYQGFIAACDSLRNKGLNISLHTYDTAKNINTVRKTIDSLDFRLFDFIVGPPYAATFKIAAEKALEERTPIISPLSDNTESTINNPYVIQLNTSEKTILNKTADYVYKNFSESNIVIVYPKNYQLYEEAKLVSRLEDSLFSKAKQLEKPDIRYTKIPFDKYNLFGLKHVLRKDIENIIIVPTKDNSDIYNIIPSINALTDTYNISLIALPSWQRFNSLDPATFFKTNSRMLSNYFIDYENKETIAFVNDYRKKHYSEPSTFSFRAYDLAKYFIISSANGDINKSLNNGQEAVLLQSCFKFEEDKDLLGKENKGLHILHYNKNYTIEKE